MVQSRLGSSISRKAVLIGQEIGGGRRVARHKDHHADWDVRAQELLRRDDGADAVCAHVLVEGGEAPIYSALLVRR